ncbi:unnamed protein product [Lactuca virosa]|uniref:PB1-like domain-containing protein n=1 Tax=Lactuca virosa TaxID=75947 RepID=A0AAU9NUH3_9ASTR|nr:unnamed protein product [Lactuca virosa]
MTWSIRSFNIVICGFYPSRQQQEDWEGGSSRVRSIKYPSTNSEVGYVHLTLAVKTRMSFSTDGSLSIDVFHKGVFVPKPLMYFNPDKTSVTEVDLQNMEFKDFIIYIRNLTKGMCRDMYYFLPNRAIVDGLRELRDEDDYVRFLDAGYKNGRGISIYIDHDHEPLMQWIEEEIAEDGVYGDSDPCSDDVDSVMSDDISVDHEVNDEVIEIPKSVDPFLSKKNLILEGGIAEEVDDEVHYFPIHDPDQKWDTMGLVEAVKERAPAYEQLPEEVGGEEEVVAEEVRAEEEVAAEEVGVEEEVAAEEVRVEEEVAAEEVGVEEQVVAEEVVEQMVADE